MRSRLGRAVSMCLALIMMMALLTGCHGSKESSEFQTPEAFDEVAAAVRDVRRVVRGEAEA